VLVQNQPLLRAESARNGGRSLGARRRKIVKRSRLPVHRILAGLDHAWTKVALDSSTRIFVVFSDFRVYKKHESDNVDEGVVRPDLRKSNISS
jgi:hypothetical protein